MEKCSRTASSSEIRNVSISEQGFTYIEVIVSFAIVTSMFPLLLGLFYQVSSSVHTQLTTHQLFDQFDRFNFQLQRDEINGVKIFFRHNQIEMMMKDGLIVRYRWIKGQLIRSIKAPSSHSYLGNTILLYHVKHIYVRNLPNGLKMEVVLAYKNSSYTGLAYVWGRIDE